MRFVYDLWATASLKKMSEQKSSLDPNLWAFPKMLWAKSLNTRPNLIPALLTHCKQPK